MAGHGLARTELEALLRARKLDRTVARAEGPGQGTVATGVAGLDEALGGGLPRGAMSEVAGVRSSGRSSVLCAAAAASTARGELVALVDTLDMFDPESGAKAGVQFERLLWIRGDAISRHPAPPGSGRGLSGGRRFVPGREREGGPGAERLAAADPWARLLDRAVKAFNLVIQAGGFDLVILDLAEVPPEAIRRLPFTTWFRLQRTLEGGRTACLLVVPLPVARSANGVTIALSRPPRTSGHWLGPPGQVRLFLGLDVEARIIRSRDAADAACRFRAET